MHSMVRPLSIVCFCLGLSVLYAQYAPQIPFPHRHKSSSQQSSEPPLEAQGIVRSINGKSLVVESADGRTFTLALNEQTAFSRNGSSISASTILPGATVHFEALVDKDENLNAQKVELLKDPPKDLPQMVPAPAAPSDEKDEPRATIRNTPVDAPNRPKLHYGAKREQSASADSENADVASGTVVTRSADGHPIYKDGDITVEPDASPESRAAAAAPTAPELISHAREWVATFTDSLPDYICHQQTTRYMEQSKEQGWQALDVVTAEVVYEKGKESYRNITVGGKKTTKSMDDIGGATSTGEFASTLRSLFAPQSMAHFRFAETAHSGQHDMAVFDFKVDLQRSGWQIRVGGQTLRPAYSGSVWIEKGTARIRRVEMQADHIPADFPLDTVEAAVDYEQIPLGERSFYLPVHAENLACQRGSSICTKNTIDFRNYHKFTGNSTIQYNQ